MLLRKWSVVCFAKIDYVLAAFHGRNLLHLVPYRHSGTFSVELRNVRRYHKIAHFGARYKFLGGNMKPIRVLFICHGNKVKISSNAREYGILDERN